MYQNKHNIQIHNQIYDVINQKYLKKKKEKNIKFPQEWQKIKPTRRLAQFSIWARHFEHEYIIKISENKIESKTNEWSRCSLKRYLTLTIKSNAEFKSRVSLIKTNSDPKLTQKFAQTWLLKLFKHLINVWLHSMNNKFRLRRFLTNLYFWTSNQTQLQL